MAHEHTREKAPHRLLRNRYDYKRLLIIKVFYISIYVAI